MNWKYKYFHQERLFQAAPEVVIEAARRVMRESLGWKVADVAMGLTAEGNSFAHAATANFRLHSFAGATKVEIDLAVERAGPTGFMLFDLGGYYNIQIRKWLDAMQLAIHETVAGADEPPAPPIPEGNKNVARLFNGCLLFVVAIVALWFLVNFICAVVGLLTGTLYLFGRGGTIVLHGLAARIVSALILLFGGFIVWRFRHVRHASQSQSQ